MGDTDKLGEFIDEARQMGVEVLPPDVNESQVYFAPAAGRAGEGASGERKVIRFGLAAIKGVGEIAVESILAARRQGGEFKSLADLCERVDIRTVNRKVLEALIKSGACDAFGETAPRCSRRLTARCRAPRASSRTGSAARARCSACWRKAAPAAGSRQPPAGMAAARIAGRGKGVARLLRHRPSADPLRADPGKIRPRQHESTGADCPTAAVTRIGGLVAAVQNGVSKKTSKPYALVTLEDLEGSVQVLCMNENYDKYRELLQPEPGRPGHRRSQRRRGQAEDFPAGNHRAGGRAEEIHEAGPFPPAHRALEAREPGISSGTRRGASGALPAFSMLHAAGRGDRVRRDA